MSAIDRMADRILSSVMEIRAIRSNAALILLWKIPCFKPSEGSEPCASADFISLLPEESRVKDRDSSWDDSTETRGDSVMGEVLLVAICLIYRCVVI